MLTFLLAVSFTLHVSITAKVRLRGVMGWHVVGFFCSASGNNTDSVLRHFRQHKKRARGHLFWSARVNGVKSRHAITSTACRHTASHAITRRHCLICLVIARLIPRSSLGVHRLSSPDGIGECRHFAAAWLASLPATTFPLIWFGWLRRCTLR